MVVCVCMCVYVCVHVCVCMCVCVLCECTRVRAQTPLHGHMPWLDFGWSLQIWKYIYRGVGMAWVVGFSSAGTLSIMARVAQHT